jgi:hypothetical protein
VRRINSDTAKKEVSKAERQCTDRVTRRGKKLDRCEAESRIKPQGQDDPMILHRGMSLGNWSLRLTTHLTLSKSYSVGVTAVLPTALTLATTATIRASSSIVVVVLSVVRVVALATGLTVSVAHVYRSSPSLRRGVGDWARNVLRGVVHVELLVDVLRDRLDFCA